MPLSLEDVHDHIETWFIDTTSPVLQPALDLLATMKAGDPGREDVLQVLAEHQARRGDIDEALAWMAQAMAEPGADSGLNDAIRAAYLIQGGRAEADAVLRDLRRRASELSHDALGWVAEALETHGREHEAMRWYTIALRDLDPRHDEPNHDEEYAMTRRRQVRQSLGLSPDHFDELARETHERRYPR